jgi:serine/threonine protein kinase
MELATESKDGGEFGIESPKASSSVFEKHLKESEAQLEVGFERLDIAEEDETSDESEFASAPNSPTYDEDEYVTSIDGEQQQHWTEIRSTEFVDASPRLLPVVRFHHSDLEIVRQIGEGGQAKIYEVGLTQFDGIVYRRALKVFKSAVGSTSEGQVPGAILNIESSYLCKPIGYVEQGDGSVGILMDSYDCDLRSLINKRMRLGESCKPFCEDGIELLHIVRLALGLKALHEHGVVHRDLKTSNILVGFGDGDETVAELVLTDFEDSSNVVGTGFWRAPEVLQALKDWRSGSASTSVVNYTPKCDVYSFGMTCYEILTGQTPLSDHPISDYDVILVDKKRPALPPDVNPKLAELVMRCWHHDPERRPTSSEIVLELKQLVEETESFSRLLLHFVHDECRHEPKSRSDILSYLEEFYFALAYKDRFLTPAGIVAIFTLIFDIRTFLNLTLLELEIDVTNSEDAVDLQERVTFLSSLAIEDFMAPLWWDNVPRPLTLHVLKLLGKSVDGVHSILRSYHERSPLVIS